MTDQQTPLTRELFPATHMGTRIYLALKREGYATVGEVRAASDDRLLEMRNLGEKALRSLREVCGGGGRLDIMPGRLANAYRAVIADLAEQHENTGGDRQYDLRRTHEALRVELTRRTC